MLFCENYVYVLKMIGWESVLEFKVLCFIFFWVKVLQESCNSGLEGLGMKIEGPVHLQPNFVAYFYLLFLCVVP
jgi:hypothetical protein